MFSKGSLPCYPRLIETIKNMQPNSHLRLAKTRSESDPSASLRLSSQPMYVRAKSHPWGSSGAPNPCRKRRPSKFDRCQISPFFALAQAVSPKRKILTGVRFFKNWSDVQMAQYILQTTPIFDRCQISPVRLGLKTIAAFRSQPTPRGAPPAPEFDG